ncbi:MAG: T9SS type A sorting domain-containing protein [Flavobacteriales bacterium]|nr:T9SS type A sorting domain-containing protein [Flavobacteriales bacterium]
MMTISRITLLAAVFAVAASEGNAQHTKPRPAKARTASIVAHPSVQTAPLGGLRGGGNDECASAIGVEVTAECGGSMAMYDAAAATESMDPILCGGFTSSEARDLWFTFVATSTGTAVRVEGTLSFDPVIEVFGGSCGDLEPIGCADETYPPFDFENTTEELSFPTRIGSTYFVRVYSFWEPPPTDHTFTFCVFEAPSLPENDVCSGAVPATIAPGATVTFTGDNTNASNTEGLPLPSVWHAFSIAECQDITIDLCGTTPAFLNWSTAIFADCPATTPIFPADVAACADGNVSQLYSGLPPGTYYYPVFRDEAEATRAVGPYTVHVSGVVPVAYCEASFTACDETIGRVVIGSIDNTSDCQPGSVVDHTDMSTDIAQGESLAITVENGGRPYDANSVFVWVDWDQDASFCGADELFVLQSTDEGLTFSGQVQAPSDALPGPTRMRVRMGYEFDPLACGGAEFGEIEDYTVNVLLGSGIAERSTMAWSVFPNPSDGRMTMRYNGSDADVVIELFDVSGRSVHQERQRLSADRNVVLDLAGVLAAGSYTMSLDTANGRDARRVIVR